MSKVILVDPFHEFLKSMHRQREVLVCAIQVDVGTCCGSCRNIPLHTQITKTESDSKAFDFSFETDPLQHLIERSDELSVCGHPEILVY